jgi:hypothetical protein
MQLPGISAELPKARIDVGVDDHVGVKRAVEQIAGVEDVLGGGQQEILRASRSVKQPSAQRRPCVVCQLSPCDPHHLKFAQAKALGRKVSD